jgi:3',5'-cyclic AMP phosphodiesterase CpdA
VQDYPSEGISIPVQIPHPLSRRWFRRSDLESAGLITRLKAQSGEEHSPHLRWALLADLHIPADPAQTYQGHSPEENARRAVAQVVEAKPDGALVAGDLAWSEGLAGDYARCKYVLGPLAAVAPLCFTVGNHDVREEFLAWFGESFPPTNSFPPKSIVVVEHPVVRMILLDSLFRTDVVGGLLGKNQRGWLRGFLDGCDETPTLLFVHHSLDEEDGSLFDADRLLRLAQDFPKVKAIFHAHDHVFRCGSWDGVHVVSLPAVGMPLQPGTPLGWVDANFTARGAELTLRVTFGSSSPQDAHVALQWR